MNVIINIENYEAFYLDFLEGNLNEEETLAFEQFLEQHPELIIDEDLPNLLEGSKDSLDKDFLSSMKMFDVTESITENNCEPFMIAAVEGILPLTKKIELNDFLAKRNELRSEYNLYEKSKLQADLSLTYAEKSSLKKGFIIPMYAKLMVVAASLIFILLMIPIENKLVSTQFAQNNRTEIEEKPETQNSIISSNDKIYPVNFKTKLQKDKKSNETLLVGKTDNAIHSLSLKEVKQLENNSPSELVALNFSSTHSSVSAKQNEIETEYVAFQEMKNPVSFLTKEINERFDQNLDVRTAKVSKKKQGGFYFKLGKFEISRKITPIQEELAVY